MKGLVDLWSLRGEICPLLKISPSNSSSSLCTICLEISPGYTIGGNVGLWGPELVDGFLIGVARALALPSFPWSILRLVESIGADAPRCCALGLATPSVSLAAATLPPSAGPPAVCVCVRDMTGLVFKELGTLCVVKCSCGDPRSTLALCPFRFARPAQLPSFPRTRPPRSEPKDPEAIGLLLSVSCGIEGVLDADGYMLSLSSPSVDLPVSDL